ncbi:glycosyltransferase family 4 protein [Actinophytocola algeriensis]|uniref:Glycosyltransferase involved in cell wall biosynthesis n=1 Tax=Actinophytocola algeriensis TaxID=1768010 RepID=A0A7W7PYZ7_9PSEU|nr:glycosyltransferase family 1 protein [Actinophytocola algeriensis]MBB4903917.1 glycosyltransferase involved in cell wall biosynthesis [Actinophytocola algeriensis]MBE1477226.1 glycosyltransferase involved in cell wall biosynthesis [Actinophytocola algeriensis]
MTRPVKVLLDGTPLLGSRTGIGRYTAALAEELASMSEVDMRAVAFTLRGWRKLRKVLPHGARSRGMPVSARLLRRCWLRAPFPPIELFAGLTDVVHGTNFVLPPALRAAGVLTIHDLDFLDSPGDLPPSDEQLPLLVAKSAARADVVCTPTRAVADVVIDRFGLATDKVVVTPLGIDLAWFTARPPSEALRRRVGLPKEYLLFVGAAGPRKALDWLQKAHENTPDLPPLVLAGPGHNRADSTVTTIGYLSDVDLRSVVAGASALVLPSRDEGFGLPVLEALACDVPVVCSDVPALREVAGGHATLVPFGNVEAMGSALTEALAEPLSPTALTARRTHAAGFTWRRTAELTVAAYRQAIG